MRMKKADLNAKFDYIEWNEILESNEKYEIFENTNLIIHYIFSIQVVLQNPKMHCSWRRWIINST